MTIRRGRHARVVRLVCWALAFSAAGGCHREAAPPESGELASKPVAEGIVLSAEQVQKLGIVTEPAKPFDYRAEELGYGVIVPHDGPATAVAELATAQAAAAQSRAVAARAQRLAGTSGAMAADAVEAATRQVASDNAALDLAERRLISVIGVGFPGGIRGNPLLGALADGKVKLLRATFPLGVLTGAPPSTLRVGRLDAAQPGNSAPNHTWTVHEIWNAPGDPSVPGRSFFGLLQMSDVAEGERLLVWAPGSQSSQRGVTVPAASLVISDGRYWCYLEQSPGHYVRRAVATDKPVADAYFVTQGIAAGDKVVTAQAGLLLARETNPSSEAD